jgi:citronellol/citronellal dehydrogenase
MMRELFLASFEKHGGAIVNMTADFRNGMPGMAHSGAARAGMSNLTMTAAYEWAYAGVRVNAVAPGWIASSGMDTYAGPMRALIPQLKRHVPMRRLGLEAEVSAAIVFLLSPAAAFVTGVTLQIDGGASLGSEIFPVPGKARSVPFDGFHRAVAPEVLREGEGA